MANMKKYEVDEVNCPESFVLVAIRGDVLETVANLLQHECPHEHRHGNAIKNLGEDLALLSKMIYGSNGVTPQTHRGLAARIVCHDGTEIESEEDKEARRTA